LVERERDRLGGDPVLQRALQRPPAYRKVPTRSGGRSVRQGYAEPRPVPRRSRSLNHAATTRAGFRKPPPWHSRKFAPMKGLPPLVLQPFDLGLQRSNLAFRRVALALCCSSRKG